MKEPAKGPVKRHVNRFVIHASLGFVMKSDNFRLQQDTNQLGLDSRANDQYAVYSFASPRGEFPL